MNTFQIYFHKIRKSTDTSADILMLSQVLENVAQILFNSQIVPSDTLTMVITGLPLLFSPFNNRENNEHEKCFVHWRSRYIYMLILLTNDFSKRSFPILFFRRQFDTLQWTIKSHIHKKIVDPESNSRKVLLYHPNELQNESQRINELSTRPLELSDHLHGVAEWPCMRTDTRA